LLHLAILAGKNEYTRELILNGAYLNISNNNKLSPLHLAAFLRDYESVNDLLGNGADPNIIGNNGYTPLHIAAEMDYPDIARELLTAGAGKGYKTSQGLTPRAIALIQKNDEIFRVLRSRNNETRASGPAFPASHYNDKSYAQYRPVEFNLPYDNILVKKRNISNIIQAVAIPVFTVTAGILIYSRSEADKYYSLSKVADSEDIARYYYKKMTRYDKVSLISGGISLVSVYGIIHSAIGKKNISDKMRKIFN